jgi:aminoglycoside phosphotransferase (APT) family kinase protein
VAASVEGEVDGLLSQLEGELADIVTDLKEAVADLDASFSVPVLTHGDLWLPNVLVREGRFGCLLDFEHARYADRFRDFGKLDEHILDAFPAGREAFLESYQAICPLPDDHALRIELGSLIHELTIHVYFLRWAPQWAPQHARKVRAWLSRNS